MERDEAAVRRRRRRWWVLAVVVVVLGSGGVLAWRLLTATHPVSVSGAVQKYRSGQTTASPSAAGLPAPASGVYVFATTGSEGIDVSGLSHRYPAQTTVTVSPSGCGLTVRWDALSERWNEWQLCSSPEGWRLRGYTEVHKFLAVRDVRSFTCPGDPLVLPVARRHGSWSIECRTTNGTNRATFTVVGNEMRRVGGADLETTRIHVVQRLTGSTTSEGTVDAWLLEPLGVPVRVDIRSAGASKPFGSTVSYHESATFDLVSTTPRR